MKAYGIPGGARRNPSHVPRSCTNGTQPEAAAGQAMEFFPAAAGLGHSRFSGKRIYDGITPIWVSMPSISR